MGWHHFVQGHLFVAPVDREGEGHVARRQDGHLTLVILIFAGVIVFVAVAHSYTRGKHKSLGVREATPSKCLGEHNLAIHFIYYIICY